MRIKQTTLLFLLAIVALAGGFYFIFDSFLLTTGEEIAKAWYYGEIVNLQEGQILPAIAKNQNFFEKSPFIKSVVLIDIKDPERNLFSVGEYPKAVTKNLLNEATKNKDMLTSFRSGFLAHRVLARLPANNGLFIIYEISSNFLIWSYFFTLAISLLFVIYLISITTKVTNSERKKQEQLRTDLLGRLAHDINSPLLAISGLSLKVKKIDNELHLRIEQATESIRRLFAQTGKLDRKLLENSISASVTDEDIELIPLAPALLEFLIQKRSEYLSEAGLKFDFSIPDNTHDKFVKINLDEFKRHLSNILKNAIEATRSELKKEISIVVLNSDSVVEIQITDSGCGISKDILSQLGKKGFSFGKNNGKGLGLHFATESIKHWQGEFKISSAEYIGTTISILLPTFSSPNWYISKIEPKINQKIIFVDDDISMVTRWKTRLPTFNQKFLSFNSTHQFRHWFECGGQLEDNLLFVFDYHLDGDNTGLAIINNLGISKESILVTSAYMDEDVLSNAIRLNVRVMPKILV